MTVIRSFRELEVYQMALQQAERIFVLTKGFPKEETYAMSDQMRRSSRAVSALVAEAWARRPYPAAFVNKVNEALGEAMETQAWLDHACRCGYIPPEHYHDLDTTWQHIGAMLHRMVQRANDFCKPSTR